MRFRKINSRVTHISYGAKQPNMVKAGYEKVADVSEMPLGSMRSVRVGNDDVVLANVDGKFHAIGNRCTHTGGRLSAGRLNGHVVQCPLHGSRFDIRTGAVVGPPATVPEPAFEVMVEGGAVMIRKSG